jgi:hypothetical protein
MAMSPAGLGTKKVCAGGSQQRFTRKSDRNNNWMLRCVAVPTFNDAHLPLLLPDLFLLVVLTYCFRSSFLKGNVFGEVGVLFGCQ